MRFKEGKLKTSFFRDSCTEKTYCFCLVHLHRWNNFIHRQKNCPGYYEIVDSLMKKMRKTYRYFNLIGEIKQSIWMKMLWKYESILAYSLSTYTVLAASFSFLKVFASIYKLKFWSPVPFWVTCLKGFILTLSFCNLLSYYFSWLPTT